MTLFNLLIFFMIALSSEKNAQLDSPNFNLESFIQTTANKKTAVEVLVLAIQTNKDHLSRAPIPLSSLIEVNKFFAKKINKDAPQAMRFEWMEQNYILLMRAGKYDDFLNIFNSIIGSVDLLNEKTERLFYGLCYSYRARGQYANCETVLKKMKSLLSKSKEIEFSYKFMQAQNLFEQGFSQEARLILKTLIANKDFAKERQKWVRLLLINTFIYEQDYSGAAKNIQEADAYFDVQTTQQQMDRLFLKSIEMTLYRLQREHTKALILYSEMQKEINRLFSGTSDIGIWNTIELLYIYVKNEEFAQFRKISNDLRQVLKKENALPIAKDIIAILSLHSSKKPFESELKRFINLYGTKNPNVAKLLYVVKH